MPLDDTITSETVLPNVFRLEIPAAFRAEVKEKIHAKLFDAHNGFEAVEQGEGERMEKFYRRAAVTTRLFPGMYNLLGRNQSLRGTGATDGIQLSFHYVRKEQRQIPDLKTMPVMRRYVHEDREKKLRPADFKPTGDEQIAKMREAGLLEPFSPKLGKRQRQRQLRTVSRGLPPVVYPLR